MCHSWLLLFLTTHVCPFMCAVLLSRLPMKTLGNISSNKCVLCNMLLLFGIYNAYFTVDLKCPVFQRGCFRFRKLFFCVLGLKCPFSLRVCASVKLLWYQKKQVKLGCKE